MKPIDHVTADVVTEAIRIHRGLGPGLLESVYESVLAASLERIGYKVDRQLPIDVQFDGMRFAGAFRVATKVEKCRSLSGTFRQTVPLWERSLFWLRLLPL